MIKKILTASLLTGSALVATPINSTTVSYGTELISTGISPYTVYNVQKGASDIYSGYPVQIGFGWIVNSVPVSSQVPNGTLDIIFNQTLPSVTSSSIEGSVINGNLIFQGPTVDVDGTNVVEFDSGIIRYGIDASECITTNGLFISGYIVQITPEPTVFALIGLGLISLGLLRKKVS